MTSSTVSTTNLELSCGTFLDMEIEEARAAKWQLGRQKYGPVFKTNPLAELDEELLDAMNYVEEANRQGYDTAGLFARLYSMCVEVRGLIRQQGCRR